MTAKAVTFDDTYAWAQEAMKEKEDTFSVFDVAAIGSAALIGTGVYFLLSREQTIASTPQTKSFQKSQSRPQAQSK